MHVKHLGNNIKRLALCALLLAFSLPFAAQQLTKILRIGFLSIVSPSTISDRIEAFYRYIGEKIITAPGTTATTTSLTVTTGISGYNGFNSRPNQNLHSPKSIRMPRCRDGIIPSRPARGPPQIRTSWPILRLGRAAMIPFRSARSNRYSTTPSSNGYGLSLKLTKHFTPGDQRTKS